MKFRMALENGKHTYAEKPMAVNLKMEKNYWKLQNQINYTWKMHVILF